MAAYDPKNLELTVDLTVPRPRLACDTPVGFLTDLAARYTPSFHLDLGNICNLSCVYCCLERDRLYYTTPRSALEVIDRAATRGLKKVALVGGEPTIRKDFWQILDHLRQAGIDQVTLTTNGLMLSYPKFVADLVRHGVTTVHLSLDAFDPGVLIELSRNDSAPQLVIEALHNLLRHPELNLFLYGVVTRANVAHLREYVLAVRDLEVVDRPRPSVVLTGIKPAGRAWENREDVVPPASEAAQAVAEAVRLGAEVGVNVGYKNLPPCLMRGLEGMSLDAYLQESRMDLTTGAILPPERDEFFLHGRGCARCRWQETCSGAHRNYVSLAGWGEFVPVEREGV